MDWERISANWPHWRERIQGRWGRLSNAHLDAIGGRREQLLLRLQDLYELSRADAERQLKNWERNLAIEEFTESQEMFADEDLSDGTRGRG